VPLEPRSTERTARRRAVDRRRALLRRRLAAFGVLATLVVAVAVADGQDNDHGATSAGEDAGAKAGGPVRESRHHAGQAQPADTPTTLAPGSDPSVLPGPVLIADRDNNRLLEVSPTGTILWRFPAPGDLHPGQTFKLPDDAFFSPDGSRVIVTQEDEFAISVVDPATGRIVYRYGHPGVPGSEPGYLHNPDDALLMPSGEILTADIKNCRVLVIRPPAHAPLRQLGATGTCEHRLGATYGSPNGAFPTANGGTAITEINGDWLDLLGSDGRPLLDTHPPGFTYPSDTNQVRPGLFLSADYVDPGAIETFTSDGRLQWRYAPTGPGALNQPSLALPLPNGDILANDDKNQRVIVIDPHTNRIVWQYGHTGMTGSGAGFLSNPDGVDLAPPHSLAMRFAGTLRAP
jgi:DNA-binding beta-propeller fold protein YncE